jgi:hypothetical protein
MLHQAAKEGNASAEYELGKAYMSRGEYEQAIAHFDRVSGADTDPVRRSARLYRLQAAARSAQSFQELELVAKKYDDYCAIYPDDVDAKLDFASLCRSLGDRASGIAMSTYWYNKAINIYMSIVQSRPALRAVEAGLEAARRKTQWQRVRVVQDSAGYRNVTLEGSENSRFSLRLAAAMTWPSWESDTYSLISTENSAVFSLSLSRPIGVAVQFLGQMWKNPDGTGERTRYSVEYLQDGVCQRILCAEPGEVALYQPGRLPAGQHLLQFRLAEPNGEEAIMMRLLTDRELQSDYGIRSYEDWYIVPPNIVRNYFLATNETPVKTWIRGPTQLRLISQYFPDEEAIYNSEELSSHVQIKGSNNTRNNYPVNDSGETIIPVPDGLHEISIAPDEENTSLGIRIYTSVYRAAVEQESVPTEGVAVHASDIAGKETDPLPIYWREASPPGSIPPFQKYGSVEIGLGYGDDSESEVTSGNFSNYAELEARHRYRFEPARVYHRGTLAMKAGDIGNVYKAEEFIYYRTPLDVIFRSRLLGFLQSVDGSAESSVEWRAELTKNFDIT